MKKLLFLTAVLTIVMGANMSYAQKVNVGLNFTTSTPLGDNSDSFRAGMGLDASMDYYFNDKLDVGIESGLRSFRYKDEALAGEHLQVVPVLFTLGLHNDLGQIVDLYGEIGGGAFFMSSSATDENDQYGGISPRIGLAMDLSDNWFLDTSLDYTHVFSDGTDFNWVGVKLGVLYTIN